MLPIIPAHEYWYPQILPNGAAMLVTKATIANRKNIVTIATTFVFFFIIY